MILFLFSICIKKITFLHLLSTGADSSGWESTDLYNIIFFLLCQALFLPHGRHLQVASTLQFFCHFRSTCEAGCSSSSRPVHHYRHLPHPHTPLPGDRDRNMDYYQEQLEVRNEHPCISDLFYFVSHKLLSVNSPVNFSNIAADLECRNG